MGPVDGHDVEHMVKILEDLKDIPGPKYSIALLQKEKDTSQQKTETLQSGMAPGLFDKDTGEILSIHKTKEEAPKYQDVFGHTIIELAKENEKIVGLLQQCLQVVLLNI